MTLCTLASTLSRARLERAAQAHTNATHLSAAPNSKNLGERAAGESRTTDGCKRPRGRFLAIPNPAALLASSSTASAPCFIIGVVDREGCSLSSARINLTWVAP